MADIKDDDEKRDRRARNFEANCDQIAELREARKHGSIQDKDLSKSLYFHFNLLYFPCNSCGNCRLGLATLIWEKLSDLLGWVQEVKGARGDQDGKAGELHL